MYKIKNKPKSTKKLPIKQNKQKKNKKNSTTATQKKTQ